MIKHNITLNKILNTKDKEIVTNNNYEQLTYGFRNAEFIGRKTRKLNIK